MQALVSRMGERKGPLCSQWPCCQGLLEQACRAGKEDASKLWSAAITFILNLESLRIALLSPAKGAVRPWIMLHCERECVQVVCINPASRPRATPALLHFGEGDRWGMRCRSSQGAERLASSRSHDGTHAFTDICPQPQISFALFSPVSYALYFVVVLLHAGRFQVSSKLKSAKGKSTTVQKRHEERALLESSTLFTSCCTNQVYAGEAQAPEDQRGTRALPPSSFLLPSPPPSCPPSVWSSDASSLCSRPSASSLRSAP
ncbi:hypothetical protein MHYP_G00040310 [Metynnis hypsauchen]